MIKVIEKELRCLHICKEIYCSFYNKLQLDAKCCKCESWNLDTIIENIDWKYTTNNWEKLTCNFNYNPQIEQYTEQIIIDTGIQGSEFIFSTPMYTRETKSMIKTLERMLIALNFNKNINSHSYLIAIENEISFDVSIESFKNQLNLVFGE